MPAKKTSPSKNSPRRSPVRNIVRETEYVINEVDAEPSKEIFRVMNMLGVLFVLAALAAGISWIYYTAKANDSDLLGDDSVRVLNTATVCFQASVVAALLYFVSRHHYRHLHH